MKKAPDQGDAGAQEGAPTWAEWVDHRAKVLGPVLTLLASGFLALSLLWPPGVQWVEVAAPGAPAALSLRSVTSLTELGVLLLVASGVLGALCALGAVTLGVRHHRTAWVAVAGGLGIVSLAVAGFRVASLFTPRWKVLAARHLDGRGAIHLEREGASGAVALTEVVRRDGLSNTREFRALNPASAHEPGGATRLVRPAVRPSSLDRWVAVSPDGWVVGVVEGTLGRVAYHPGTGTSMGESDIKALSAFVLLDAEDTPDPEDVEALFDGIASRDVTVACGAGLRRDAREGPPRIREAARRLLEESERVYGVVDLE